MPRIKAQTIAQAQTVIAAAGRQFTYRDCGDLCETDVIKVGWQGGCSWETQSGYIWRLIGYGKSSFGWSPETILWSTGEANRAFEVAKVLQEMKPEMFAGCLGEIKELVQCQIDITNAIIGKEHPEWLPCHLERGTNFALVI